MTGFRNSDPSVPNEVRYRAALHPVIFSLNWDSPDSYRDALPSCATSRKTERTYIQKLQYIELIFLLKCIFVVIFTEYCLEYRFVLW